MQVKDSDWNEIQELSSGDVLEVHSAKLTPVVPVIILKHFRNILEPWEESYHPQRWRV